MEASFSRADDPEDVTGRAIWGSAGVEVIAGDPALRALLRRIFRATPVVVEDAALRTAGTSGPAVPQPGTLAWFVAAARERSAAEGLTVRFSSSGEAGPGWDPAGAYRTFPESVERRGQAAGA